jgi:hypothetical protein
LRRIKKCELFAKWKSEVIDIHSHVIVVSTDKNRRKQEFYMAMLARVAEKD